MTDKEKFATDLRGVVTRLREMREELTAKGADEKLFEACDYVLIAAYKSLAQVLTAK